MQGVPVQDAIAEAELTELFEVFSSINEAWEGLDKRGVSTMFIPLAGRAPLASDLGITHERPPSVLLHWRGFRPVRHQAPTPPHGGGPTAGRTKYWRSPRWGMCTDHPPR